MLVNFRANSHQPDSAAAFLLEEYWACLVLAYLVTSWVEEPP